MLMERLSTRQHSFYSIDTTVNRLHSVSTWSGARESVDRRAHATVRLTTLNVFRFGPSIVALPFPTLAENVHLQRS